LRSTLRLDVPMFSLRTSRILPVVCGEHLLSAKQMRPGQPPDRIVRGFLPAESPIGVEMTASARQRSNRVPRLPTRVADPSSCDPESALATLASSCPCSEEHGGEEAATPGNQSRSRAFSGFPPAIHSRESPLPLALPQSSGKLRNSHVSMHPLSARSSRTATQKPRTVVKKLWRMRLPCGSQRKTKNKFPGAADSPRSLNN
jgi:hypothetical protein